MAHNPALSFPTFKKGKNHLTKFGKFFPFFPSFLTYGTLRSLITSNSRKVSFPHYPTMLKYRDKTILLGWRRPTHIQSHFLYIHNNPSKK